MSFLLGNTRRRIRLIAVAIAYLFSTQAFALNGAQAVGCIKAYYNVDQANAGEGDILVAISPGDAQQAINTIKHTLSVLYDVTTIACNLSDNANVFYSESDDGLPEEYTNKYYVIYNREWILSKLVTGRTELDFILGHEFGHITNNHETLRKPVGSAQKEAEADYSGACAVAHLHGQWAPLKAIIENLRTTPSEGYPTLEQSLDWANSGFQICGGIVPQPAPSEYEGIRVVYFPKEGDNGVVDEVLKSKNINFELGQSYFSFPTNGITCTVDVDYQKVRDLAISLTEAGVDIYWINKALPQLNAHHRITIEAEDFPNHWTPLNVSQLACLSSCSWLTSENACSN